jgi:hypothetical protein
MPAAAHWAGEALREWNAEAALGLLAHMGHDQGRSDQIIQLVLSTHMGVQEAAALLGGGA